MDNRDKIQELDELIASSTTQVGVDGTNTSIDLDSARRERARLIAEDTSGEYATRKRPKFGTLRVDSLW